MKPAFICLIFAISVSGQWTARGQSTAFAYQGRLNDNNLPATGNYDLRFSVFDAVANGNLVAGPVTQTAVPVAAGLFSVQLDFGPGVFTGGNLWLEVAVQPTAGAGFTTLAPRQPFTPVPYALYASLSGGIQGTLPASQISGTLSPNQLPYTPGSGVTIVTNSTPALVSYPFISGGVNQGLAVSSGYCYIGDTTGCLVFSIANPLSPQYVSTVASGSCNGVAISGNLLYLATVTGLKIYDLSNPANPASVGSINNGFAEGLCVVGSLCYVADTSDGLRIYDVSTPALPVSIGHINSGGSATGVAVSGNYCYLANSSDGLRIYDVTTPSSPSAIGHVAAPANSASFGVNTDGHYCYLANNNDGVRIYDVSTPATPTPVGHLGTDAYTSIVVNHICYVGSSNDGLHGYDVSNPASAVDLGVIPNIAHFTVSLVAAGNFLYSVGAYYLEVFDFSAATAPAFAGSGALLTGLNASQLLYGQVSDSLLSGNVAMLNGSAQTFTGDVTVEGVGTFGSSAAFNGPHNTMSGVLDFGTTTRQMLDLWSTHYTIGVQSAIEYFRSDYGFAWYQGGTHSDTKYDSGGGAILMQLDPGGLYVKGTLLSTSDRNLKENFRPVNPVDVLDKVSRLPISKWNYTFDASTPHMGPVAQDFYDAFRVGPDDKHIATVDESGVALAAIQGLNQKFEAQRNELESKDAQIKELQTRLDRLEKMLSQNPRP